MNGVRFSTLVPLLVALAGALALPPAPALADGPARAGNRPAPPPVKPDPVPTVLHVPADELDVLLKAQGKAVVVSYAEFEALLAAARGKAESEEALPPLGAVRVAGEGTLDLSAQDAARFRVVYRVLGLAPGPRSVGFVLGGGAYESVRVEPEAGAGPGRYEEKDGLGRIYLEGPGMRRVTVEGSATLAREGPNRLLDLWLPNPAAMTLAVTLPAGMEATLQGEGAPQRVRAPAERALTVVTRPTRGGNLRVHWAPAAQGTEGPSVLDAEIKTLYTLSDGVVTVAALVRADVLRTPTDTLTFTLPADLAVHRVEGVGVTGQTRSEDRTRLSVRLEKPVLGEVKLLLSGERPYRAEGNAALPRLTLEGAVRQRGEVALTFRPDVNVRGVSVSDGRRISVPNADPQLAGVLRYSLFNRDGQVSVDLAPGALRVDATSTYYLNLGEPGQTLIATTTYRVLEGTLFRLRPLFPPSFDLRELTLNGESQGFSKDRGTDGRVEITLSKGVAVGGEVLLVAMLERAQADWVPEKGHVAVPFAVPTAMANREEGYLAVGADGGFEVLETGAERLLPVGAADLTARGLSSAGLIYGYRLDGAEPHLVLDVVRREPLIEAEVVTSLHPGMRRLDLSAKAVYRIQRAGVRRLFLDLPAWAGDQVSFSSPHVRSTARLAGQARPADVPAGYERWQVDLEQRVSGTTVVNAAWFLDLNEDDWKLAASKAVAARVPVARSQRMLVVQRSEGLEVSLPALAQTPDVRPMDLGELPVEAAGDPLRVLEVLRLSERSDGIELAVQKHQGAAVLNAIATEVRLRTAVAREGILRTHAELDLFNIDRQFLEVALPPGSTLIGAVVDQVPIKPLVNPEGLLLVTVPTTRGAGRSKRTRVELTYETHLEAPASGRVRILAPAFAGLEVLRTTHEVGVEPDVEIASVRGDLLPRGRVERPARAPWIAGLFSWGGAGDTGAPAAAARQSRYAEGSAPARPAPASGPAPRTTRRVAKPSGPTTPGLSAAGPAEAEEPQGEASPPPPPAPPAPELAPARDPAAARTDGELDDEKDPESLDDMGSAAESPADPGADGHDMPQTAGAGGRGPAGGKMRQGAGQSGPGEGGEAEQPGRPGRPKATRKGQLSLDVPVILAPNRVVASRIGAGGTLELELVPAHRAQRAYQTLLLLVLGLALGLVAVRRLPAWLVVLAGGLVALVVALTLGAASGPLAAAVADASCLLAALLVLRAAVRWLARAGRGAPRGPGTTVPPLAASLLLALATWGSTAAPAYAEGEAGEGEPAERAAEPLDPGVVIAPLDPKRGAHLDGEDRVFVPLATWLELQRTAHPERDPELVALGQVVTLVEASYRVEVGGNNGEGSARFLFAQRGRGSLLVPLPISGLAITEARLDGQPVRLLLDGAQYRVPLDGAPAGASEGASRDHLLELTFQVPVTGGAGGRSFAFGGPTCAAGTLEVLAGDFAGDLSVSGAGRVVVLSSPGTGDEFHARAYLGRPLKAGLAQTWTVALVERAPASLPSEVRTRAESRTVHSLRDGGTETHLSADVHVLQGRAPFVDVLLPDGVSVLEATGPAVARWETSPGRVRLVFTTPQEGKVALSVRAFRSAASPERSEDLPELAVLGVTGESGVVVVNADPSLRLVVEAADGLFRTGRPSEADAAGPDGQGRVAGAWRFAARPARLVARAVRAEARLEFRSRVVATFGDDRVRTRLEGVLRVQRAPQGEFVLRLPGVDEVRAVEAGGLLTWWLEGEGDARRLHVRVSDLVEGERGLVVTLERRLGGQRDTLVVPRWRLEGAQSDQGLLVIFSLPDVEPQPGALAGLKALPPSRLEGQRGNVPGAKATHAFEWESAVEGALPLVLRTPEQELEAVVVSQVMPSDEEQRLEHLVLFDVRRGSADLLTLFVPDGGLSANDVVRARDLRELRSERATRTDPDGKEVNGLLYSVRLQSQKTGLIEVTVSQLWPAGFVVRSLRPEGVKATRWFSLVRTFLDGSVSVRPASGAPDPAELADLPFLPTGVDVHAVRRAYAGRAPYTLEVVATRDRLEGQASAFVLSAHAEAVIGLDGEARVRMRYRLFNRSRQFLRVRLPEGCVLYGAVAAGHAIKPLAGTGGSMLLPVPKVPLGGAGYEVAFAYRAPASRHLSTGGDGRLPLPELEGVEVDRLAVTLRVPEGFDYDFATKMNAATLKDVEADRVEAAVREAQEVLKVAEKGTLEQRMFACDNSAPLVQQAEQLLVRLTQEGASPTRLAELAAEVRKVEAVAKEAQARCQMDANVFMNEQQLQANQAVAANANGQTLVLFTESSREQTEEPSAAPSAANWRFNSEAVPLDKAGKQDLLELKERLQRELTLRDESERSKNVNVEAEGKSRAAQSAQSKTPQKQAANDEATLRYDENRNNDALNKTLLRVQTATRQLGVEQVFQSFDARRGQVEFAGLGASRPGRGTLVDLDGVTNGLEDTGGGGGAGGESAGYALPPSAGTYFNDGSGDGDYSARTENIYGRSLGRASDTRSGLMGVDVPLPVDGRVYWFTSAKSGAALAFQATPQGTPTWLRILLAVSLLALLAAGLTFLARRRDGVRPR